MVRLPVGTILSLGGCLDIRNTHPCHPYALDARGAPVFPNLVAVLTHDLSLDAGAQESLNAPGLRLGWFCVLRRVLRPNVRVLGDHHEVVTRPLAQRCSELSLGDVAVRHGKRSVRPSLFRTRTS